LVNIFDEDTNYRGPAFFGMDDIEQLTLSDKFFARKFPKDSIHPV